MKRRTLRLMIQIAAIAAWAGGVGYGAVRLWQFEAAPGDPGHARAQLPTEVHVARTRGLPTLVLSIHPHCPCSRATIDELARLMTDCRGKVSATVLMLDPAGMPAGWAHTDLWASATAIPGVTVVDDRDGIQSRELGAATSGQALLYSAGGKLLYAGGITESRGHSGDNAGESAIIALVLGQSPPPASAAHAAVYGCPLFDKTSPTGWEGTRSCPR